MEDPRGIQAFVCRSTTLWGIVILGILLRFYQYMANTSLWLDEAMLAHNIVRRSLVGLCSSLDYEQLAPLMFLWIERLAVELLGHGELALRLFPFLAGCTILPLGLWVGRRMLPKEALALGLLLVALSDPLIDYSAQAKPYAMDGAVALLIILLCLRAADGKNGKRDLIWLGLVGLLAPWISFPAPLVMAAACLVLLRSQAVRRSRSRQLVLLLVVTVTLLSSMGLAVLVRSWYSRIALQGSWGHGGTFAPFPPTSWEQLIWYPRTAVRTLQMPGGIYLRNVGVVLALLGCLVVARARHWARLILLVLPLLFLLAASALKLYPFSGRLLLFAGPSLSFMVAIGLHSLWPKALATGMAADRLPVWNRTRVRQARIGLALLALNLTVGVEGVRAVSHLARPRMCGQVRDSVELLCSKAKAEDVIYVYYGAAPTFDFYMPDPSARVHYSVKARGQPKAYCEDIDCLCGEKRVWVLLSHIYNWRRIDEEKVILHHLDEIGRLLESHKAVGGGLYLYTLEEAAPVHFEDSIGL
ncbi:glycosyltransferase family 39 protein [Candidatus Eisenbacteria bacterium]|uniref:Glycosyltransferase family 39 protein n=1 Tax=Eiseniibacteriota bacterium TaxID=2212470 RepID=A0ABV6YKP4_UNCEI